MASDEADRDPEVNDQNEAPEENIESADQGRETGSADEVTPESDANAPEGAAESSETNDAEAASEGDAADSEGNADGGGEGEGGGEDDLPEFEPLTPELLEDEAIRGDFMLRWAIILLALLFGCRQVSETTTLVHTKTGQYLMDNGFLPPAKDVFSYTASDHAWANPSWLFDVVSAGVYSIRGDMAFSIFTALVAGIIFWLMSVTSRPGVSTWLSSGLAGVALLGCFPQFSANPEIITLLGVALTLWAIYGWSHGAPIKQLYALIPIFLLWGNLDNRAFLGGLLILLYAVGETFGEQVGMPGVLGAEKRKKLWTVTGACLVALCLNPNPVAALTAPLTLYMTEYPIWRDYHAITPDATELQNFAVFSNVFFQNISLPAICGLSALVAGGACLGVNRDKLEFSHVLVFTAFTILALATSHELAAASIVAVVLGSVNAQAWYQDNCSQEYKVETKELLISRGGRVLTVIGFFALAFFAVNGWITQRGNTQIGLGFTARMKSDLESLEKQLADQVDENPYNFSLGQGDQFIWIGKKVFCDNRVALYAGSGDGNIIMLHDQARRSLRQRRQVAPSMIADPKTKWAGDAKLWKATFDRFKVTHVVPRMGGANPDYVTYYDLLTSPNWILTSLGSAGAVFYRDSLTNASVRSFVSKNEVDYIESAFKTETKPPVPRVDWPREPNVYQKFLGFNNQPMMSEVQEARHLINHVERATAGQFRLSPTVGFAMIHLAIRRANEALAKSFDIADAYRLLARSYTLLSTLEQQLIGPSDSALKRLRWYQSVNCYHQALILEPEDAETHYVLSRKLLQSQKLDVGLREIELFLEHSAKAGLDEEIAKQLNQRCIQEKAQLTKELQGFQRSIQQAQKNQEDAVALAQHCYQSGYLLEAKKILDENQIIVTQNPTAQALEALVLMESGRAQEAVDRFQRFESAGPALGLNDWQTPAAWAVLATGDYDHAIKLWNTQLKSREQRQVTQVLQTIPLKLPVSMLGQGRDLWPTTQTATVANTLFEHRNYAATLNWHIGLSYLESGRIKSAQAALETSLELEPDTMMRPIIAFYLTQITDKLVDAISPNDMIPVSPDMFLGNESEGSETPEEAKPKEPKAEEADANASSNTAESKPQE